MLLWMLSPRGEEKTGGKMVKKLPTCWDCSHCGQAVTMDRRDLVCRAYGEVRVLGKVGEVIGIPEDCPLGKGEKCPS